MKRVMKSCGLALLVAGSITGCTLESTESSPQTERMLIEKIEAVPLSTSTTITQKYLGSRYGYSMALIDTGDETRFILYEGTTWRAMQFGCLVKKEIIDGDDETMTFYLKGHMAVGCETDGLLVGVIEE
jgi:hypothetical protein